MKKNLKTSADKKNQEIIKWLASFPEINPNPVIEVDLKGAIYYLNPSAKKLFPHLRSLGAKHPYLKDIFPLLNKLKRDKRNDLTRKIEINNSWYYQTLHYISDTKRIRIYGLQINEMKKMEDELIKTEKKLLEVIRATGAGYYEHATDSSVGSISNGFARILGFKLKEIPKYPEFSKWLTKRIHKDDVKRFETLVHGFHRGESSRFDHEHRVLAKDGSWRWLHFISTSLQENEHGLPIYVAGLVLDVTKRRDMEEALKESEKKLNKTQEIAHLGSWAQNLSANQPYWSEETYRIYGYKPYEIVPSNEAFDSLVHPDDRKMVHDTYYSSMKEGKNYSCIFRIIRKSTGEERTVYEKCEYVKDSSGKITGSLGMVHDITEQKQIEDKIIASETRYRRLFESAKDGILILDAKTGMIVDVNPFLIQLLGFSHKTFLGKKVWEIGFFKDIIANRAKFTELQQKKYVRYEDLALKTADGRRINVEFVSNVYQVDHQEVIQCNIRNITERKSIEEALKKSEMSFRAVAETAKDAIVSANSSGKIIYFNKGAELTFGYTTTEALNKPITILMPQRYHKDHLHGFSRFLANGKPHIIGKTVELVGIKKNGSEFPIELSLASWQVENKGFFTAIIRDITERKELQQHKDDFITIAGHELRTPVSVIKLMNQVLQEMLVNNPHALKYLKKIEHQSNIQANLINDLLSVSKIQTGKLEIRKKSFDLQNLIQETVEDMQETTREHKFIIRGKIYGKMFSDKEKIEQVLVNFYSNAIKFSPRGGKIAIVVKESKKEVVVSVIDCGIGIPKEHHHGIFQRFYRVYGTGEKLYPGLGMGLYISYHIIKLLNGRMWFESNPGKGSTFCFSLPFQT